MNNQQIISHSLRCIAVVFIFGLQGCVALAITAGGVVGGAGVDHTINGVAYKTFNHTVDELRGATLTTLSDMDMKVVSDQENDEGWEIAATAVEREIDIEFERISSRTTRMRVVAHEGVIFLKDRATATEIIVGTTGNLPS